MGLDRDIMYIEPCFSMIDMNDLSHLGYILFSVTLIACYWRRFTAKKLLERRRKAANDVRK